MYSKKRDISVFMFSSFHFLSWFGDFIGLWSVWHSSHTLSPSDDVIGPLEDQLGVTERLWCRLECFFTFCKWQVDKLKRKLRKIDETRRNYETNTLPCWVRIHFPRTHELAKWPPVAQHWIVVVLKRVSVDRPKVIHGSTSHESSGKGVN